MNRQKRVAALHDISGFGKCSLTVALPIISAAGIETCVIPTAVLSTHTGGFTGFTYRDLTQDIMPFAEHWRSLGLRFDALYSGFVGSIEQLDILCDIFDMFRTDDNFILVDPVMADNGELYKVFADDFPAKMRKLVSKADIIIPNITEAVLLLDKPYKQGPYTEEYVRELLEGLAEFGVKKIILTGVHFNENMIGTANYDCGTKELSYTLSGKIEGFYHGTGDVFGSALCAALMRGHTIERASKIAVDFTVSSIARTKAAGTDARFGVNFEEGLSDFIKALGEGDRR
jgi:pyridoxine kinase